MRIPPQCQAIPQVKEMLSELLGIPRQEVPLPSRHHVLLPDALLRAGPHTFAIEWKGSGALGPVSSAAGQVKRLVAELDGSMIPLVAVPYMGEAGRSYCEEAGVAWLDLSGNARIFAPGLRVHVVGHRNRFLRPGRPESAFAPKASRLARWLLMHPTKAMPQREVASAAGLDEGHTSRVVAKLIADDLVVRGAGGITARNPDLLLDAWRGEYRFDKQTLIQGHIAARTGDGLVRQIARTMGEHQVKYAVTGLAAAWLLTQHAGFRLAAVYLAEAPSSDLLSTLAFREEPRGGNTWLVIPNDEGVFHGASEREGVRCVHPVQAYLDLKAHPERAEEAAAELRNSLLRWRNDG